TNVNAGRTRQGTGFVIGVIEGQSCLIQDQTLLRIHGTRSSRWQAISFRSEGTDIIKASDLSGVSRVGMPWIRTVECRVVPSIRRHVPEVTTSVAGVSRKSLDPGRSRNGATHAQDIEGS